MRTGDAAAAMRRAKQSEEDGISTRQRLLLFSQGVGQKAERRRHKSGQGGQTWTLRPAGGGRRADKLMVGLALMVGQAYRKLTLQS